MSDKQDKRGWIKAALGITIPDAATAPGGRAWQPAERMMPIFMEAKETVDSGIDKLQQSLRVLDNEDLDQIADFGLFGATQGETVGLIAALHEAERGGEAARQKVLDAVHAYQDFLDGAPIVDLIESNPFGVAVPIRKTLGAALQQLESLAAA